MQNTGASDFGPRHDDSLALIFRAIGADPKHVRDHLLRQRLRRRALVVLFTDFVDTTTAELLLESLQRISNRHVVLFVTLRDSVLQNIVDAPPDRFEDVTKSVVAHDMLRDREIVFERLERLGIHCLDVSATGLSSALINRYLQIKQRGLI